MGRIIWVYFLSDGRRGIVAKGRDIHTLSSISVEVGMSTDFVTKALCNLTWSKGIYFREFSDNSETAIFPLFYKQCNRGTFRTFKQSLLPINHNIARCIPEPIIVRNMEDLDSSFTVALSITHSDLSGFDPVFGAEERVFQTALSGKYLSLDRCLLPDAPLVCSPVQAASICSVPKPINVRIRSSRPVLRRTNGSTMEASDPSDPVQFFQHINGQCVSNPTSNNQTAQYQGNTVSGEGSPISEFPSKFSRVMHRDVLNVSRL